MTAKLGAAGRERVSLPRSELGVSHHKTTLPQVHRQVAVTRPRPPHRSCQRPVQGTQAPCDAGWEGAGPWSSAAPTSKLKQRGRGPGLRAGPPSSRTPPRHSPGLRPPASLLPQGRTGQGPSRSGTSLRACPAAPDCGPRPQLGLAEGTKRGALSQTPREHDAARKPQVREERLTGKAEHLPARAASSSMGN